MACVIGVVCASGASGVLAGVEGDIELKIQGIVFMCWLRRVLHRQSRQTGQRPRSHGATHQTAQQQQSDKQHRNKARHGGFRYAL